MTPIAFPVLATRITAAGHRTEALLFELNQLAADLTAAEGHAPEGQDRASVYAAGSAVRFAVGGLRRELASLVEAHAHILAVNMQVVS